MSIFGVGVAQLSRDDSLMSRRVHNVMRYFPFSSSKHDYERYEESQVQHEDDHGD
jgi:hypothetical protein